MPITPWRSMWDSELLSIKEEMDRIFDEFFGKPVFPSSEGAGRTFPVDVLETEKEVIIYADLPAVNPKELSITAYEDTLTIRGERKRAEEAENLVRSERFYGVFQRTIPLPEEVAFEKAKASYKDGVLKIVIPKLEKALPREIKIEIE